MKKPSTRTKLQKSVSENIDQNINYLIVNIVPSIDLVPLSELK